MFKDLGGEKLDIQGLTINLPPVGYVFNKFTQKLEKREVFKRSGKPKEQYWEIPKKPFNVKRRLDIEYKKWLKNPSFFEPELQSYREREWDRTTNGFWFYLKGKPTYITGQHYFMLAHWTIEGNAPDFRVTDMEWHYFWEYCWEDPKSYGMLEVTQRRQGKCLKINELCRMHDGSVKKVDEIKIGDLLMGPDSKPRLVKDVYGGIDFMYEVVSKSSKHYYTGEHILCLQKYNGKHALDYTIENISVKDFVSLGYNERKKYTQTILTSDRVLFEQIKVKQLPPDRYIGIETDGDHLFLLSDGTIVHNSVRAGNAIYYRTSRAKEKKSGIQSKTDADGERLFSKQVVNPMKKLERIFLPLMDKALGSTPKKKVSFNKTSSTAEKEDEEIFEIKELISEIDFRSSTESAYDGDKLYVYISDECGKVEKASIYKRHGIVKPCMTVGKNIIGKMMYTTTVEDIGDADKYDEGNFERLWDESDQNKKDIKTGQTISGLYRYFLPADHALDYDEYGYPKVEENRMFLENQRESKSGNSVEKASYIRRYPLAIEEAFWTPGDEGIYDQIAVQNARDNLKAVNKEDLLIYGNLVWKNGIRGNGVEFIETKHGRFAFHKDFNIKNECLLQNSDIDWTGDYIPKRAKERIIGVDPFDHKEISKGYTGSKAAAYLYIKYMPRNPLSETFVAQYLMRPEDIDEFHEDIAKLAFATGAEVLVENQKQALIKFLGDSKFKQFLVSFDGNTTGVPASPKNKTAAADATAIYIRDSIEKVVFNELLDDWSRFNLKNSTKFDAAMASGWALLGSFSERTMLMTNTEEKKQVIYDMSNFY